MRLLLPGLLCLLLAACAAPGDPWQRLEPAPTASLTPEQAVKAMHTRWPAQFRAVQTVTVDFGPVARTVIGYLIVQQPGRFRLQGMSEQGLRLFEIIGRNAELEVLYSIDEFDGAVLESIARDIRRVFVAGPSLPGQAALSFRPDGTQARWVSGGAETRATLVGPDALVDSMETRLNGHVRWRADHYEWQAYEHGHYPAVVVLRERGSQPYVLTVQTTRLESRDTPWPDSVFARGGE
jgi:hypothetical protein